MNFQYIILLVMIIGSQTLLSQEKQTEIQWKKLKNIPDQMGFAGAYVGVANDYLVIMGGANFPDGIAPWNGGKKIWTDRIFVLMDDRGDWVEAGHLPVSMGYGAVTSYHDAIYIAGGSNAQGHLAQVYKMVWRDDHFINEQLPDLPHAIANCATIRIDKYWYILGGIEYPDSQQALNICWRLDLEQVKQGWEICPPVPGEGRMLAVAGDLDGKLIVTSGVSLHKGERTYQMDAYICDLNGWRKVAGVPQSVAAAPNPAWFDSASGNLLIFGGDNGVLASKNLKEKHPGFSNKILYYRSDENTWQYTDHDIKIVGEKTWAPVTTSSVFWKGGIVLPTGEIRPGIRSPQVLFGTFKKE